MKFNCKRVNLKEAITNVERIISKQPSLPILSNILIKSKEGRLLIASTNLEIAIETYIGAKITKEGEITIPPRMLSGFLGSIKDEVIEGEIKSNELIIATENHNIKIKGMDAKDYPIIPEFPQNFFFKLEAKELNRIMPIILTSVAHNDTRQELNGIYMGLSKKEVVFASTDSCRLSEGRMKIAIEKKDEFKAFLEETNSIIVPSLAFSEASRMLSQGDVKIVINQNQLFLENNSTRMVSRLINGTYPDYKQILPDEYAMEVKLNKEDFLDALKITALVASDNNGEVVLKKTKKGQEMQVFSQGSESGENKSNIQTEADGEEFEVVFNCRYLIDGLNVIESANGKVLLKLNKSKSPVMIRGFDQKEKENTNSSYVIMPIIKE
ncbi:MAG: DNA polymerase III subunit beta [Candidatus Moranbacteria bacterium]|nr:DNA polymerase III subunit beta [Candidatus Moranbacteria bacterium]